MKPNIFKTRRYTYRIDPVWAVLIGVAVLAAGCELMGPEAPGRILRALTGPEMALVEADNDFGLRLFTELYDEAPADENIVVSPLSVSFALGMTLNGAAGETYDGIRTTLGAEGLTQQEINEGYKGLGEMLPSLDPRVRVQLANAIFSSDAFPVKPAFTEANASYFDAEVDVLDFKSPSTLDKINGWVKKKTEGLINGILEEIKDDDVMFIVNAVYFKGTWKFAFDKDDTAPAPFHRADGSEATVRMMHQEGTLPFADNDVAQIVDLPYGDSLYSMTILLPKPGRAVDDVVAGLRDGRWAQWVNSLRPGAVSLYLPRFELDYKKTLNTPLRALGMDAAFFPGIADFSGISDLKNLVISDVLHKTFIEVSEQGTEAAAVTSVGISITSTGPPTPTLMRVDRPFIFCIRERHTGTILFIGRVSTL